jgi:UDP-N-acetylmuramate dehydrogenase
MQILENISLKTFNTFGIDAKARYFIELLNDDDVLSFLPTGHLQKYPFLILGGGSNILFSKDFEGTVVKVSIKGMEVISEDKDTVTISASGGESWDDVVKYCVDRECRYKPGSEYRGLWGRNERCSLFR